MAEAKVENEKPTTSGKIKIDESLCSGCGVCELACSLYHEGECNPSLSRINVVKEFQSMEFTPRICIQCDWPSCYFECPVDAIKIDEDSSARFIDEEECIGCGACARVCPLMPEKDVLLFKEKNEGKIYLKCDLCRERDGGPLCVEVCPRNVLTYEPGD